ncbi:hypothetical protein GQ53DRAFT_742163 [Thozetella sp. PMI_491]|nr:hypothetical protein GQ53DRAFT_742163 [Thozetella sp. PMI_491]
MALPLDHPSLLLSLLPQEYYVVKQDATDENWNALVRGLLAGSTSPSSQLLSFTRTDEEISIVGACSATGEHKEGDWRCIRIAGPMDFALTGILNAFTTPLNRAGVPVFAVSTYNTDYVLVPKEKVETGVEALKGDGWKFKE